MNERERIARDFHDGAIQRVFAVGLTVEGVAAQLADLKLIERLQRTVSQLELIIREIRRTIFDPAPLTPPSGIGSRGSASEKGCS